jgi:hypothetical protein
LGPADQYFSVEHAYSCTSQPIRVLRFRIRDHGLRPFLTRSGLDQLPMLISVLRGEMSIVGPHRYVLPPQHADDPVAPALVDAPFLPGLVNFNILGGEATDMDADLFYVLNWSLRLDAISCSTISSLKKRTSAILCRSFLRTRWTTKSSVTSARPHRHGDQVNGARRPPLPVDPATSNWR